MEKKIDWSKAPKGATHYAFGRGGWKDAWYSVNGNSISVMLDDGEDSSWQTRTIDSQDRAVLLPRLIARPAAPAVDWSKAPEWADRVVVGPLSHSKYWANDSRRVGFDGTFDLSNITHIDDNWRVLERRPVAPTWPAEGVLPPVGTVCEVFDHWPHESYKDHVGKPVRIVAHDVLTEGDDSGTPVAVYAFDLESGAGYHALVASRFRPIKTAEQIAAEEERQAAIAEMVGLMNGACRKGTPMAVALYDAGYRKQ